LSNGKVKIKIVLQKRPNTACTGQVRAFRRTFGDSGPNGGFGVWWLYPPNPALAGNASRWAFQFWSRILLLSFRGSV
jgi:hypothetical protein